MLLLLQSFLVSQFMNILPLHLPHDHPEHQVWAYSYVHSFHISQVPSVCQALWWKSWQAISSALKKLKVDLVSPFLQVLINTFGFFIPFSFLCFHKGKCRFSLFIFPVLRPFGFNGCWGTSYLLMIPYLSWVFSTNLILYIPQMELFFSVAVILKLDSLLKFLPALSLNDPAWPHKENKGRQLWNISIFLTIHPHLIHIFLVFFKKGTRVRSSKTRHNLHN